MVFVLFCGLVFVPHAPHFFGVFLAKSQRAQGGVLNLDTWDSFDF